MSTAIASPDPTGLTAGNDALSKGSERPVESESAVISEIAPFHEAVFKRVQDARTLASLGGYDEIFRREPGARELLDQADKSVRQLEAAELARLQCQQEVFRAMEAVNEQTAALMKANGWSADDAGRHLPGNEDWAQLAAKKKTAVREFALASRQVSDAMNRCERDVRIWAEVEEGKSIDEAQKAVDKLTPDIEAVKTPPLDTESPGGPAEPVSQPVQDDAAATASEHDNETFEINGGADRINFIVTRAELRDLPDDVLEERLLAAGVPGEMVTSALAKMRAAAGVTPPPPPAGTPPGAGSSPEASGPEPEVFLRAERTLHKALSAADVETDASRLSARYLDAVTGQNVLGRSLRALDELGGGFFDRLAETTTPDAVDAALTNRRDYITNITHPFSRAPGAGGKLTDLLDVTVTRPPAAIEWLMGSPDAEALAHCSDEIRQLARLTTLVESARDNGMLKDARGFDERNVDHFGSDRRSLGVFRSEVAMREFGQSCRKVEAYATENALTVADRQRAALAASYGTVPLALARAAKLLDATINPGKLDEEEQAKLSAEMGFFFGADRGEKLVTVLEETPTGQKVVNLFEKMKGFATSDDSWAKLAAAATALAGPEKEAHFLRNRLQGADQSNIYLEAEVEAQRLLGADFQTAYSRMDGSEKHNFWRGLAKRTSHGRNLGSAMGSFLLIAEAIYREDREDAAKNISDDVHKKLNGLRVNAIAVEERLRVRDDHQEQVVNNWRTKSRDIIDRTLKQPGDAGKDLVSQLPKAGGLDGFSI